MKTFGENLREIRRERGLTQAKMAEIVGAFPEEICRYETTGRSPRLNTMQKYAKALGVSPMRFINSDD